MAAPEAGHGHRGFAGLMLAAIGVVYGDIGTSPLYAMKECFHGPHAVPVNEANVLGVLSLVLWALIVVVSLKYLAFIMRADNRGEGGIFALLALIPDDRHSRLRRRLPVVTAGALFGAALLYGDGVITPAISVLSAVEGLSIATEAATPFVVPLTCVILFALFMAQKAGTARVGGVFGPVMVVWFVAIGLLGLAQAVRTPQVLAALSPTYAVAFFGHNQWMGFVVLGSVFLAVTGGEALYADLGHFGARPIRRAWFSLILPCLMLCYFGQAALLLREPHAAENPFYGLVPSLLLYPMVALSTMATVIASQALITGAFSLTRQAIQLGFFPRMRIIHTSGETEGQIYVPLINSFLMIACISLVLAFRASSALAAAYGLAVTATMAITSLLYYLVLRYHWGWTRWKALPLVLLFLVFDLAFFSSNLLKFFSGGWFPVVVALGITVAMSTWRLGRREIAAQMQDRILPLDLFLSDVARRKVHRVPGTAVFMSYSTEGTPPVLLHHLKHNQVLHQQVVLMSIRTAEGVPRVAPAQRLTVTELGQGFYRIVAIYGYTETPNVPELLRMAHARGLRTDPASTTFYLGRESLLTVGRTRMAKWRKRLFAFMSRNAQDAARYFNLPARRVVELGMQIEL